jgi:pimeloyl-ACP methyl ester carboxylesterase
LTWEDDLAGEKLKLEHSVGVEMGQSRVTPGRTGVLPHLARLGREIATPRGVRGLVTEGRGIATHILRYPLGIAQTRIRPTSNGDDRPVDRIHATPVVLVHGYFHNRSGFVVLSRELRRRGFRWIHGMNYNPVPELAERFGRYVDDIRRVSGSQRVHLVGHSLGGVIARWYTEELGGYKNVDTIVTIGTPHHGTYAAYIGVGQAAKDMRPGSDVIRTLELGIRKRKTTYVNLYSDLDFLIVPPSSAVLPDRPNVHNHLIEDIGHTSLLLSDELVDQVCGHLEKVERKARMNSLSASA